MLLTGALALAACDDGGSDAEADQEAADAAIAAFEAELEDRGFEAAPDDDDDDSDLEFESEECQEFAEAFPGEDEELPGETASAESGDFERGELDLQGGIQESAQGGVGLIEDEDQAEEFLELLGDDRLGGCLAEAVEAAFAAQAAEEGGPELAVGEVEVDERDLDVGDDAVGLVITTSVDAQGLTLPVAFEFAFARAGRTAAFTGLFVVGADQVEEDAAELVGLLLEEAGAG